MAKKTEKREKCTLQDLAYGKKTEKTWKHTHTHTDTHTLQDLEYDQKH